MPRRVAAVLADMLDAIDGIEQAVTGKSLAAFEKDWLLRHGVERGIEIISEAARHIPDTLTAEAPAIPWDRVRGIGNILRHEYHRVADDIVWAVAVRDLPPLKAALLAMRAKLTD